MRTIRKFDEPTEIRSIAATLLEAYYFQDERESHLLGGNAGMAVTAGARAIDRMASAYEMEFPWLDRSRVRGAGAAFMYGLFVQDEIENWAELRALPEDVLGDALVSDLGERYGPNPIDDDRWERVEASLGETCRKAGIDERYARLQTRFWVLHGQSDPRWERVARDAHEHKLRALVADPPASATERLGTRFVDGVRIHDEWTHRDESADLEAAIDLVAGYYEELVALRSGGR